MDKTMQTVINAAGGLRCLARSLGITHTTIRHWEKVPAERLVKIEEITGIPRHVLRPDLFENYKLQSK